MARSMFEMFRFENPENQLKSHEIGIVLTLMDKNDKDDFCKSEEEMEKIRQQRWWSATAIYKKGIFDSERNNVHKYGDILKERGLVHIGHVKYTDKSGRKKEKKMFRISKSKKTKTILFEHMPKLMGYKLEHKIKQLPLGTDVSGIGVVGMFLNPPYSTYFGLPGGKTDYLFNEKIKNNDQKIKKLQEENKKLKQARDTYKPKNKRRKEL